MDRSSSQKINKETTNMKNTTDQMDITVIHCGGAGRLWANTENVFAPLMTKVGSWNEHNGGLWAFIKCLRLGTDDEGSIRPALKHSKASLWPPVSCEQGLLFHDKTPFRVLSKSCYVLLLSRFSRVRLCATPWWQPTRLPCPWDSPGKNTGVGCHFLLQCMKVKSESEVAQLCPTLSDPMACSLPGFSIPGIFQARVLEWGAIAFSDVMS